MAGQAQVSTERLRRFGAAVRRSQAAHCDVLAGRDAEIRRARNDGLTVREIAAAVGISRQMVHLVLAGEDLAAQKQAAAAATDPGAVSA